MRENVLIIDGTNMMMRSFHAMMGTKLSATVDGEPVPTGAVNTFLNLIAKYVRQVNPDRMVVCWDGGRSEFRTRLYPQYKAARKDRDEDEDQKAPFSLAKEGLTLMGVHHLEVPRVEADDLVAAYWREHRREDEVFILSGDKDFLQLVEEGPDQQTVLIRPGTTPEFWDVGTVVEKLQCLPHDLPNVMALAGDTGDGVPGVPGVAHKTAIKLLAKYDWSLWELLQAGEKKLLGHEDDVMLYRKLVNLRQDGEWDQGDFMGGPVPPFNPTSQISIIWQSLLDWLALYDMKGIAGRLRAGTFWQEPTQQLRLTT